MQSSTVQVLSGSIFTLIAFGHLMRVVMSVPAIVGGWEVPLWPSVLAIVVAGGLAASNFAAARRP